MIEHSPEPVILLNGIRKTFGRRVVLRNVTGSIAAGRVVGLLGKNGEGKTTLLRILLDILVKDAGTVSILGKSPDKTGRIRKLIGYVPERPAFHEFMSVHSLFQFRARLFPTWDREKADQLAKALDLDLKSTVKEASKGTLAKIAWICATAHNPRVLLLDEPTSGLDPLVREAVLTRLVSELVEEGKAVFVANHRMDEMFSFLDEIWVLSDGIIRHAYEMERLRESACRITGRIRKKSAPPVDIFVYEEHSTGEFVRWLVLESKALEWIREAAILEQIEVEPLSAETMTKLLLANQGVNRC